jgi:DNA-binding YbaB/EbfC family protein
MNQAQMMKQAQKMQQELLRMQEEQETKTYTAKAGGGMVAATVNGKHEVVGLTINPEAVDPDDVEMLQDLVIAAVNEALRQMTELEENEMNSITGGFGGGLGIPGL